MLSSLSGHTVSPGAGKGFFFTISDSFPFSLSGVGLFVGQYIVGILQRDMLSARAPFLMSCKIRSARVLAGFDAIGRFWYCTNRNGYMGRLVWQLLQLIQLYTLQIIVLKTGLHIYILCRLEWGRFYSDLQ